MRWPFNNAWGGCWTRSGGSTDFASLISTPMSPSSIHNCFRASIFWPFASALPR